MEDFPGSTFVLGRCLTLSLFTLLGSQTELQRAGSHSVLRAETIITTVRALEGSTWYAISGGGGLTIRYLTWKTIFSSRRYLPLCLGDAEFHCAGSYSIICAETVIAAVRALEGRAWYALLGSYLLAAYITLFPLRASPPGAEPSNTVGGALAAVAILHLHLVRSADLPIGLQLLLLDGIVRTTRLIRCLYLWVVALFFLYTKLSRTGHQQPICRAATCVAIDLKIRPWFTHLAILQCQRSSDEHRRN